ncbi:MAG TPA: diacylglycerol kinase family protein [Jatrophihabitans sp.]|nr:diacylglycerol kinase family protein [Jatrophihabitans sp.]
MVTRSGRTGSGRPAMARRLAAAGALLLAAATWVFLLVASLSRWPVLLAGICLLALVILSAWYALSRAGRRRYLGVAGAGLGVLGVVLLMVASGSVRVLGVAAGLAAASIVAAGYALATPAARPVMRPAGRARHPVLLVNPKSGGGKAERYGLVDRCRQRGIEPIVLGPGSDLAGLVADAIARGADLVGMAGGDGSQALVASVASRHGVPVVVVPAGTRNHFALDLGLDRDDVAGALDAYTDGVERTIDLAEVNGRVFVNNASMGAYARVVQSPEYRDAKLATAAAVLPAVIGPRAAPAGLRYLLPSGERAGSSVLVLVSNNPYRLAHLRGAGVRERLDAGVLGIVSVRIRGAADVERLAALEPLGRLRSFDGWQEWTAPEFELDADGPVEVGVDGEALLLQPPLRFRCRPGALTVRLPRSAAGRAPARPVYLTSGPTLVALWLLALGRS